jgi:HlyD family secretion protein
MKKKAWIIIGVVSLVVIMISVSVYREVLAKGPSVKTAELKEEEISSLLMIPGTVQLAEEQIVYASPEKGELKELLVKEGQTVKVGDVLARLQNSQLELEMEQNKLAIETANLKISQIEKQIKQLKEKEKTLVEQIGKEEAKKQITPETEQLDMEKKLANLDLKQAMLQKDIISKRQSELEIKSTIDGVVLTVKTPEAASIEGAIAEPIVHIGKLDALKATSLLSEYDTLKVSVGQKVNLKSDAVLDQKWDGEIENIALLPQQNQTGVQTGNQAVQYPVSVKITGDLKMLKPGFQVIMEIETDKKVANVVPMDALYDEGDQPFVYIVKEGKAEKKEVQTGITSGSKIEILEGISNKDQIIIDGPESIKNGLEVTVK